MSLGLQPPSKWLPESFRKQDRYALEVAVLNPLLYGIFYSWTLFILRYFTELAFLSEGKSIGIQCCWEVICF